MPDTPALSRTRAITVLLVTTLAFAVCFAVWMMFGVTGIPIRKQLGLNASEFGLLTATPILTGALLRLPLGVWTDRFGGRIVMVILLVACALPLWLSSYATQLWQFLALGLALGMVGASFAVGTPYVARFFPNNRGFAMGTVISSPGLPLARPTSLPSFSATTSTVSRPLVPRPAAFIRSAIASTSGVNCKSRIEAAGTGSSHTVCQMPVTHE